MSYPTVDDVIAFLDGSDRPAMATVVRTLGEAERECRRAAEANLRALYALRDKYEPRPQGDRYVNWTGD